MLLALALACQGQDRVEQRKAFVEARDALSRGDIRTFHRLRNLLKDYPLVGYLDFYDLKGRLAHASEKEVRDFLSRYKDSPLSERLRYRWLEHLAKQKRWRAFLSFYRPPATVELQCHALWARWQLGQRQGVMEAVEALWKVGHSQPKACDPIFTLWQKKAMGREDVWDRIHLAVKEGRWSLVDYLARFLPQKDRARVAKWREVRRDPKGQLRKAKQWIKGPQGVAMAMDGIERLARRDAGQAMALWPSLKGLLPPEEREKAFRVIALAAARQGHPRGRRWIEEAQGNRQVREWRIRLALEEGDWKAVLVHIRSLPAKEAEKWRYWEARAREALGQKEEAKALYARIARERGYYGFLAADRLGLPYALQSRPVVVDEKALASLMEKPGLQRARELFLIGERVDARREWRMATRSMDKKSLRQAAVLADRWGWHDQAIFALARAGYFSDLERRFPLAYRMEVDRYAKAHALDPAWIYGILRQESAFWIDARSPAGALGLMQIMPRTARYMARLLRAPLPHIHELLQPERNIHLGSAYLKKVLEDFGGHEVLATAAYNAGPSRVRRWLPEAKEEAAMWVEAIPFGETRRYVQRVMAYTAIYEKRLGRKVTPLASHMPSISPESLERGTL